MTYTYVNKGRQVLFGACKFLQKIHQIFQRDCNLIDRPHQEGKTGDLGPKSLNREGGISVQRAEGSDGDSTLITAARL